MDCPSAEQILDILDQASEVTRQDPYRQGHLIVLPNYGQVIMTGDFHGCLDNFARLEWFADLKRCSQRHVVIHELIHTNGSGESEDGSCMLLVRAAQWKIEYPDQVHFLLGNHDLAQLTAREISKGGAASIANFNRWIVSRYGEANGTKVIEKIGEFLATLPVAARCPNRLWLSHSLPGPYAMDNFDFSIFDRQWQWDDFVPRGSVYETVWGRGHTAQQLADLAEILKVDYFILGHQRQDQGYMVQWERLIILASDHGLGCFMPIDLSTSYTFPDLVRRIKFFYDLPEVKV